MAVTQWRDGGNDGRDDRMAYPARARFFLNEAGRPPLGACRLGPSP